MAFNALRVCLPAAVGLMLISGDIAASEMKQLTQSIPYAGQKVMLDIDVGQATLIATDEPGIRIGVAVESAQNAWFDWWGSTEVDDVQLQISAVGDVIELALSEQDDIRQEWKIYLPSQAAVDIDMGVGQVEVNGLDGDVDIELGVGSASIDSPHRHKYKVIDLRSGVGDVSVMQGDSELAVERQLVSQSYLWHGQGSGRLSVGVGVGEIRLQRP